VDKGIGNTAEEEFFGFGYSSPSDNERAGTNFFLFLQDDGRDWPAVTNNEFCPDLGLWKTRLNQDLTVAFQHD